MIVLGVDFTSVPKSRKPIVVAHARLSGGNLHVHEFELLHDFCAFESFLSRPGPWLAALDFPFGLPRRFVEAVGWPSAWEGYVEHVRSLGKEGFEDAVREYASHRPIGDKEHKRRTDALVRAASPMKLGYPAVGKMFFQGAPRLLDSGVSIDPCRISRDERLVVEAYPGHLAIALVGKASYKSGKSDPIRRRTRENMSERLPFHCRNMMGFSLSLSSDVHCALLDDDDGDKLDALLAAVTGAWAANCFEPKHGIPPDADPVEGWIISP